MAKTPDRSFCFAAPGELARAGDCLLFLPILLRSEVAFGSSSVFASSCPSTARWYPRGALQVCRVVTVPLALARVAWLPIRVGGFVLVLPPLPALPTEIEGGQLIPDTITSPATLSGLDRWRPSLNRARHLSLRLIDSLILSGAELAADDRCVHIDAPTSDPSGSAIESVAIGSDRGDPFRRPGPAAAGTDRCTQDPPASSEPSGSVAGRGGTGPLAVIDNRRGELNKGVLPGSPGVTLPGVFKEPRVAQRSAGNEPDAPNGTSPIGDGEIMTGFPGVEIMTLLRGLGRPRWKEAASGELLTAGIDIRRGSTVCHCEAMDGPKLAVGDRPADGLEPRGECGIVGERIPGEVSSAASLSRLRMESEYSGAMGKPPGAAKALGTDSRLGLPTAGDAGV